MPSFPCLPPPSSVLLTAPGSRRAPLAQSPREAARSHPARPPAQEASTGAVAWPWRAGAVTTRAPLSSGAAPPRAPRTELGRGSRGRSSAEPSFAPARLSSLRLKASFPWARRLSTTAAPKSGGSGGGPDPARRTRGKPAGRLRPCSPRPRGAELFVLNPGRRGVARGPPSSPEAGASLEGDALRNRATKWKGNQRQR